MFIELKQQNYSFKFGDADIVMRYDLNALSELEERGYGFADVFAEKMSARKLFRFFRAAVSREIDDERLWKIFDIVGGKTIFDHCRAAMNASLPQTPPDEIPPPAGPDSAEGYSRLRCCICDVMGKSEEFFWSSTLRELLERWEAYAAFNGFTSGREKIKRYDDEE